jgi:hypothetical protein
MLMMAIGFFSLAALLGLVLLSYVLTDKETPKGLAFVHGPLGALGIIFLGAYAFLNHPSPWVSLILFVLAAIGGFVLIFKDLTGNAVPKWLAITHGIIAIAGFIFLLIFIFVNH